MTGTIARWLVIAMMLAAVAEASTFAQDSPVQEFRIHLAEPAFTKMPLWVAADLGFPLEVRYPYRENPQEFGPNRIEIKREGRALEPRPATAGVPIVGSGILNGSIAPPSSPTNRLPLHLRYSFNEPGSYSIRWTAIRHRFRDGRETEIVVAQSSWLTFEVSESTPEQREAWLTKQLASIPNDPGLLVGDWLPSALAAAPDLGVLRVVVDQLYSQDQVVSSVAMASLGYFREGDVRDQVMESLRRRGPNEKTAYLISWREPLFHDHWQEAVRISASYLQPGTSRQTGPALQMLGVILHAKNDNWPGDPKLTAWGDEQVLSAAPNIIAKGQSEAVHSLASYLGSLKTDRARELLWKIVQHPEHEQAMTCLTGIGDARDLARLGELLVEPGDTDPYGRDRASLPHHLVQSYGDRAVPFLEKALADSPYPFVRTQSAEELALLSHPAAFRFFLDAVEENRFYKAEMVNWLKDYFPKEVPRDAEDAVVVAFLKSRLGAR